jgi:hypothetical protein
VHRPRCFLDDLGSSASDIERRGVGYVEEVENESFCFIIDDVGKEAAERLVDNSIQ